MVVQGAVTPTILRHKPEAATAISRDPRQPRPEIARKWPRAGSGGPFGGTRRPEAEPTRFCPPKGTRRARALRVSSKAHQAPWTQWRGRLTENIYLQPTERETRKRRKARKRSRSRIECSLGVRSVTRRAGGTRAQNLEMHASPGDITDRMTDPNWTGDERRAIATTAAAAPATPDHRPRARSPALVGLRDATQLRRPGLTVSSRRDTGTSTASRIEVTSRDNARAECPVKSP